MSVLSPPRLPRTASLDAFLNGAFSSELDVVSCYKPKYNLATTKTFQKGSVIACADLTESDAVPMREYRVGNTFYRLGLPGLGTVSDDTCGRFVSWVGCDCETGRSHMHRHAVSCHRVLCPECHDSWIIRAGQRAADRLNGMRQAYLDEGIRLGSYRHVVLSMPAPPSVVLRDGGRAYIKEAVGILKQYANGASMGGAVIFHPWRKKHDNGSACEDGDCKQSHHWVWSPHIHFIGCGWWNTGSIYHETGWILKVVPDSAKGRDIKATVTYQLSHAGVIMETGAMTDRFLVDDGRDYNERIASNMIRYIGCIATNKGGQEVIESGTRTVPCPSCGRSLQKWDETADGSGPDFSRPMGEHIERYQVVRWHLHHKGGGLRCWALPPDANSQQCWNGVSL